MDKDESYTSAEDTEAAENDAAADVSAENDAAAEETADNGNEMPGDAARLIMAADLNTANETEDEQPDEDTEMFEQEEPLPEPMPEEDEEEEENEEFEYGQEDRDEQEDTAPAKRRPRLFRPILFVIIVCFCIIAAADMISQQNEIEQLEQETVMMTGKIEETKQKNDEYTALLEADEDEFMERVAVEQLGYSYPNERRYYIVNRSEEK